jgi:hypothetical protein
MVTNAVLYGDDIGTMVLLISSFPLFLKNPQKGHVMWNTPKFSFIHGKEEYTALSLHNTNSFIAVMFPKI